MRLKAHHAQCLVAKATCKVAPAAAADGVGNDLGGEYARQRNYLEKTIESLKRKLAADAEAHRTDELRIMGQNVSLIRELNELRREIKVMAATVALLQQPNRHSTNGL